MKTFVFSTLLVCISLLAFHSSSYAQCSNSAYVEGGPYVAGSIVSNGGKDYTCLVAGWCNGAAWAYGPGTGSAWASAWNMTADPCATAGGGGGGGGPVSGGKFYSCPTVNTWTKDAADCGAAAVAAAGIPGATDTAYVRDDWFNAAQTYSLPNLAWGMDGATFFSAKPKRLVIQSGGRVVFNGTSYTGLPGAFSLVTENGGTFSSYTALAVINSITNDGAIHLYGSITNGNNIAGSGSICFGGNFENSTLGGSINGAWTSATEATLLAGFFTTVDAALGGRFGSAAALPVELIHFEVMEEASGVRTLTWRTGSEINSSHFEVERSFDGVNWEVIDYVTAAGISDKVMSYETVDFQSATGSLYYRLKIVDVDQSTAYSIVRQLDLQKDINFKVFYDGTHLNVSVAKLEGAVFTVRDITGKVVFQSPLVPQTQLQISKSVLGGSGSYLCELNAVEDGSYQKVLIY